MNVKSYFMGKIRKKIITLSSAEFAQIVLKVSARQEKRIKALSSTRSLHNLNVYYSG